MELEAELKVRGCAASHLIVGSMMCTCALSDRTAGVSLARAVASYTGGSVSPSGGYGGGGRSNHGGRLQVQRTQHYNQQIRGRSELRLNKIRLFAWLEK